VVTTVTPVANRPVTCRNCSAASLASRALGASLAVLVAGGLLPCGNGDCLLGGCGTGGVSRELVVGEDSR
jgi:hypothetical protein